MGVEPFFSFFYKKIAYDRLTKEKTSSVKKYKKNNKKGDKDNGSNKKGFGPRKSLIKY